MGTAADRAAASCQRLVLILFISGGPKVSKGRSESPLVVPNGHEAVTCGGIAATPCLFPQKEEDHPQQRMVKDIHSRRGNAFPSKGAYPQSVLQLTAPSAEEAFWQCFPQSLP